MSPQRRSRSTPPPEDGGGREEESARRPNPEPEEPARAEPRPLAERMHALVLHAILPGAEPELREPLRALVEHALEPLPEPDRSTYEEIPDDPAAAGAHLVDAARRLVGTAALAYNLSGNGEDRPRIRTYVETLPDDEQRRLFDASVRAHLKTHTEADSELIRSHLVHLLPTNAEVPAPMAAQAQTDQFYSVDTTNLPYGFDQEAFIGGVNQAIGQMGVDVSKAQVLAAGVAGMLLLDGQYDPTTSAFDAQVSGRLWTYIQNPLLDSNGVRVGTNRDAFNRVHESIQRLRGGSGAYYQELAAAARSIIDGQRGQIINTPILLDSAVTAALQSYGSGVSTQGSFDLPALSGPSTGGGVDEMIGDHIRAVGMHFAAYQLEVAGLWQALQRSVEIFMNGQLPVSADMAGQALNAYYWDQVNQMSESARWMQYTRVLGVSGGEVSKDVQPNKGLLEGFNTLISSLSEYDRQQRVADMLGNSRGLNLTGEHVRKAGRDFASNATLYGYGFTQFAARKLQTQIQTALNIFKLPDFQAAWGVQSAWQAIQRVMAQEFQKTPNIVKQRTLAESGKKIFDLVAAHIDAWASTQGRPLFLVDGTPELGSDINEVDRIQFMRHAEFILAVQGTSDADVVSGAAPKDTPAIASIPSLDGTPAASNGHNADIAGQIQQMLSQNQTPTPDQLRKLIGV